MRVRLMEDKERLCRPPAFTRLKCWYPAVSSYKYSNLPGFDSLGDHLEKSELAEDEKYGCNNQ